MKQIFIPILVLLLVACGNTESRIIGKWKGNDGGQEVGIEFQPDGTVISKGIITATGKYAFRFEDKSKVEFSDFFGLKGGGVTFDVKVENDKLYMTNPDRNTTVYEKVRD